ncbi:MAG: hypothetical protein IH986_01720 [Planctomycetes bacterium]|nr:hypothetical protein [Planctomycetota bacterium]
MSSDLYCPDCGYNLRGLPAVRCPECGLSVEALIAEPGIPWVRRHELGWFRAYWKTVWTVTFRHKRFAREILRPVSYADAQRFRWVTIVHAYVPLLASLGLGYFFGPEEVAEFPDTVKPWKIWIVAAALLLFFIAATGVPSYFFHPRRLPVELQNRAVAMSYYTSAALAWMFVSPLVSGIGLALEGAVGETVVLAVHLVAASVVLMLFGVWLSDLRRLAGRILRARLNGWLVSASIGLLWLAVGVFIVVGLPAAVSFVVVVVRSLT